MLEGEAEKKPLAQAKRAGHSRPQKAVPKWVGLMTIVAAKTMEKLRDNGDEIPNAKDVLAVITMTARSENRLVWETVYNEPQKEAIQVPMVKK